MRVFWIAMLLAVAFAMPAWAKPSVSSAISQEGWRVHTIKFDSTTDDSEPFGLGPSCSVRVVTYGGSNTVSLYQVPTKTTAAASGSLVGTFSSVSTSATTFRPGQGFARAVSASGSDGTIMEVWCSNTEIAGGGGAVEVFNVASYGVVADGVTDDSAAFNAASAAAASAGGGIIYIPEGDYCLGETGANRVYSGLRVTSDNTYVVGDGEGRTILRPCGDNGNYAVVFCEEATASACTTSSPTLYNVGISDLTIKDDDRCGDSGHVNFVVGAQSDLSGGTPAIEDAVTWDGGSSDGEVYCYQASTGNIGIHVNTGTLTAADVVTDGSWTATMDSVEGVTTEESHGVIFRNVDGAYMARVTIDGPADEGLDCSGCVDVFISDVRALNTPRNLSGGAAFAIGAGSSGVRIVGADVVGGESSSIDGSASSGMLAIATNSGSAIDGVSVSDSKFVDTGTGTDLVDIGILLASNSEVVTGVSLSNVTITADGAGKDAISSSGGSYVTELLVSNSKITGSVNAAATHTVSFTNVVATDVNDTGSPFTGIDTITGGSYTGGSSTSGTITIASDGWSVVGAKLSGSTGDCININADFVTITGIVCDACGGGAGDHCVNELTGADQNSVFGNTFLNNAASTGFRVESGTSGAGCIAGVGANSICGNNTVEN